MNACTEWRESLVELVFGEPDDVSESRLNEHLGTCVACRKEEATLLQLRVEIAGEAESPTAALRERIRAAVRRQRRPRALMGFLLRPIPVYAALIVTLIGVLLAIVLPRGSGPYSVPAPTARHATPRAAGAGSLPFHVVGSYDTGVQPALYEGARPGTAPAGHRQARDSL